MKKHLFRALSLTLATLLTGTLAVSALAAETGGDTARWQPTPTDPTAFTDAARIGADRWEAVAALAQLGVIAGKDDGSFDPAVEVTRAEAAKLLYYMRMGNGEAEIPVATESSFSDMENHWARTAVEYCVTLDIIAGRGDGNFDPDAPVTGSELCKMALVALGYDPGAYGLADKDWEINVNMLAHTPDAKLYAGLESSIDPNAPLTRAEAAQLLFNTLKATVIKATIAMNEKYSEPYYKYEKAADENGDPVTFLQYRFGLTELPELPDQPTGE